MEAVGAVGAVSICAENGGGGGGRGGKVSRDVSGRVTLAVEFRRVKRGETGGESKASGTISSVVSA